MRRSNSNRAATYTELNDARRDLLEVLEGLENGDWDKPTLCEGWRVRDVVSHLASAPDAKVWKVASGMLRARGNVDRMLDEAARDLGERPVDEILEHFRSNVEATSLPPTVEPEQFLTDVVIHSLDICQPNGWELHLPADRIRLVLSKLVTLSGPFRGKERAEGLHFDTTDIDWRCGCGHHVRGPARVTLLAIAGRPVCDQLHGDGVAELAERH